MQWIFYDVDKTTCGWLNSLRPRQNGRHFADDIFKCIFLNENVWIPIKISLKFVPKGPINNIPALVQIMAWRRPGGKPLSEPMMVSLLTHICVARPQWVKCEIAVTPLLTQGNYPNHALSHWAYDWNSFTSQTKSLHWSRVTDQLFLANVF